MRNRRRSVRPRLALAVAMLAGGAAGCGDKGHYELSWRFTDQALDAATGPRECSSRGVDAWSLAASSDGDEDVGVVACGPGKVRRQVPVGTWTVRLAGLGPDGHLKDDPSGLLSARVSDLVVRADEVAAGTVEIQPLPACRDGVDNDADGAVDLADPGCGGDPDGATE